MHYMKREKPVIGTQDFHFDKTNVISDTFGDYNRNQGRGKEAFLST